MNELLLNSESYLYLHPSENPAVALVSPALDSSNYHSWSRSMITTLSAKNKVEFVNGKAPEPLKTDRTYGAWSRCNNMVVSWLVHSVSISIRQSVLWMDKAEEIWNDLKSRYAQGDLLRVSELQQEASSIKQGSLSVTEYFTKLRVIWDKIENFRPNPICSCTVKCTCLVLTTIAQRKREDRAMQFLRGLNEQYSNIRSHVLLMDLIPTIPKIFSYVAQQERQLTGNNSLSSFNLETKEGPSINAVKSVCEFCGCIGHNESVCYKKHGVPPNYDGKGKGYNTRKTCTYCEKLGHTIDVCYKKHGYPPGFKFNNGKTIANNVVAVEEKATDDQILPQESQELVRFSPEQYKALLALIQQPSAENSASIKPQVASISSCSNNDATGIILSCEKANSTSWILDSGATDHVSSSLTNFHSYHQINPITVKLPNGHLVYATHLGTVQLSTFITLIDVLYVPSFTFNLISISKLVFSTNCKLIYSSNICILQDTNTKVRIGTTNVSRDLYQFTPEASKSHTICSTITHPKCKVLPINLWHFRMDHPSLERLQAMQSYYRFLNNNKNFICNTCHYAKHKRLPFSSSISHASNKFELLHIDIWGPCSKTSMHGH
ncbi:uncharacterized protein LOC114385294 [Glycine soja]|uniref:uncharacterized protein n=1 Tax=Glycine max TaxID=3847 RepID=UPI000E21B6D4|nr:uncharacterized protein LOC102669116 [Glycine max]XP_028201106.1 uncharacterized protein LOC114385294 [Glycine soja]|eukprot:XP_025983417.1 uncharacterized protein LOC102669116 [Glycine max]